MHHIARVRKTRDCVGFRTRSVDERRRRNIGLEEFDGLRRVADKGNFNPTGFKCRNEIIKPAHVIRQNQYRVFRIDQIGLGDWKCDVKRRS